MEKGKPVSNDEILEQGRILLAEWGEREWDPLLTPRLVANRRADAAWSNGDWESYKKWTEVSAYTEEQMCFLQYQIQTQKG